jgi:3-dehydroquinate synthase
MKIIQQDFSVRFTYPVIFTEHLFSIENQSFIQLFPNSTTKAARVFFVIDSEVTAAHPTLVSAIAKYMDHFPQLEQIHVPLIVPGGEQCKNEPKWVDKILEMTSLHGIDRHSYITGIGGGALLDMVGFAAAISHRGIRHIRIPTTVLSQNDSGVGVKNSVNSFNKKNYLGTFAPPYAVINDSDFLLTLHERDWRAGISEAIKVALIKDLAFFERIEQDAEALASRQMPPMQTLIWRCAEMHIQHIAGGDPFESGSSRPLDFGHWAAHKLEQLTKYEIRHGEAVAIGIALDSTYSMLKGMISEADLNRILTVFAKLGFDIFHEDLLKKGENGTLSVINGLHEFREHLGGELTIMLLEKLGKGKEVHEMDTDLIEKSLQLLQKQHYSQQMA